MAMLIKRGFMWLVRVMLVCLVQPSLAHDVPATKVMLDIGLSTIGLEAQLPISELKLALDGNHIPLGQTVDPSSSMSGELWLAKHKQMVTAYLQFHMGITTDEGTPFESRMTSLQVVNLADVDWVQVKLQFTPPANASTRQLVLVDDAIVEQVVTHNILVSVRSDFRRGVVSDAESASTALPVGMLHYQQKQLALDAEQGSWLQGVAKLFQLGMQHIAEGSDHILFLLVLLLAAPLRLRDGNWRDDQPLKTTLVKIIKTVTGFTLGHSLTLALGALGWVTFPGAAVEVLIAFSILVSAAHVLRPIFANREHWVAAFFGLIHGMAFAVSLSGFNYDPQVLGLSILSFNLGIEAMQLLIVALVLPSLLLLVNTPWFTAVRLGLAVAAGICAYAWMAERALNFPNPLTPAIAFLMAHAGLVWLAFTLLGVAARVHSWNRDGKLGNSHIHFRKPTSL